MHVFSLIAPQQPKNAITNTTTPATISRIGNADNVPSKITRRNITKMHNISLFPMIYPERHLSQSFGCTPMGPLRSWQCQLPWKLLKCQLDHCFCKNYNFFLFRPTYGKQEIEQEHCIFDETQPKINHFAWFLIQSKKKKKYFVKLFNEIAFGFATCFHSKRSFLNERKTNIIKKSP